MARDYSKVRDFFAFWIFGLSNNFAYVIMLSAAEDIMSQQTNANTATDSNSTVCMPEIHEHTCEIGSLGAVLLADVIPSLFIKLTFPFFMHRIPIGIRHVTVCVLQALSYLIVAFSTSVPMSLLGVVFAAAGSGLGEICYLSLASHYSRHTISAWSSGTGGAGIIGALAYAGLTEPHLANLSPRTTLFSFFCITYFTVLTPASTVYRISMFDPRTWIVPSWYKANLNIQPTGSVEKDSGEVWKKSISDISSQVDTESNSSAPLPAPKSIDDMPSTFVGKVQLAIPLFKYMIPLSIVYFAEYLINQGLTAFLVFDCSHGFGLSKSSQYRWYQVLYQLGVFISRSSVNFIQLPFIVMLLLPVFQCLNAVFFLFDSMYFFVPHIWITFLLILFEGFFGGASYVNTSIRPLKEFSLGIASISDGLGIVLSGFVSIPIHNMICSHNTISH
ncbi:Battenin [Aphelenchoides bicaudatus]|nr:Battenin [Aphelenchoides bicaudatus]